MISICGYTPAMGAPSTFRNDSAMEDPDGTLKGLCCHAHTNYCVGQSELKGEVSSQGAPRSTRVDFAEPNRTAL